METLGLIAVVILWVLMGCALALFIAFMLTLFKKEK